MGLCKISSYCSSHRRLVLIENILILIEYGLSMIVLNIIIIQLSLIIERESENANIKRKGDEGLKICFKTPSLSQQVMDVWRK